MEREDIAESFENELLLCLKAKFSLLFILTQEEKRAFSIVERISHKMNRRILFPRIRGQTTRLHQLIQKLDENDDIIVLDNIHRMLDNADTIRSLVDAVSTVEKRTIIVIAPNANIPPELERLCTMLTMPLPTVSQIEKILKQCMEETHVLLSDADVTLFVRLAKGMTLEEATRAFRKAFLGWPESVADALGSVLKDKQTALRKSGVLSQVEVPTHIDDVGGLDRLKEWLGTRRLAFSDDAKEFGLPSPRGLLIMGIQGCGKSLTSKSIAGYWQLPLVRLDLSLLFGDDHPELALSNAFHIVEAMAPVVLWIDELEKGFDGTRGPTSRVLGGLVTWLQEKQEEVFVVATANQVKYLPPELPRKGRFDEIFFVDLPDLEEREEILRIHLKLRNREPVDFDLRQVASKSERFTGSELEQVVVSGLFQAFVRGEELTDEDMLFSIQETVPLYDTFEEEIKHLREWARRRARPASTDRKRAAMFRP